MNDPRGVIGPGLTLERLDYLALDTKRAMVRMQAALHGAPDALARAALLVRHEELETRHRPYWTQSHRPYAREPHLDDVILWKACFRLPLEVVEYPAAVFGLAIGCVRLALPAPGLCPRALRDFANDATASELVRRRVVPRKIRRSLATGLAGGIALATVGLPVAATADKWTGDPSAGLAGHVNIGRLGHHPRSARRHVHTLTPVKKPSSPTSHTTPPTTTTSTTPTPTPTTTSTTPTPTPTTPASTTPTPTPTTSPSTGGAPTPNAPSTPTAPSSTSTAGTHHSGSGSTAHKRASASTKPKAHSDHNAPTLRRHPSGGAPAVAPQPIAHPQEPAQAPAAAQSAASSMSTAAQSAFLDPFTVAEIEHFQSLVGGLDQPPKYLVKIYKAAARRYHVPWQILAAINAIETDYGRDLNISSAGAVGWMQFMPGTWEMYGTNVDGVGRANPYDPQDAIFSAARYLAASGAPKHMRRALFAYNHALWYVDAVLWRAQMISDHALRGHRAQGYQLPLDRRYMRQLGRTDDGVDIEDAPDGTAVYSMTPGIVTAVASDPSGFGPDYPVVLVTKGPLTGQYIYYGHVEASLVKVGQKVLAGQPIAVMGHTGDAASLGHGHIEIGFSDASGDPLNHHGWGMSAWTPSGDAMRQLLVALTKAFKIKTS